MTKKKKIKRIVDNSKSQREINPEFVAKALGAKETNLEFVAKDRSLETFLNTRRRNRRKQAST